MRKRAADQLLMFLEGLREVIRMKDLGERFPAHLLRRVSEDCAQGVVGSEDAGLQADLHYPDRGLLRQQPKIDRVRPEVAITRHQSAPLCTVLRMMIHHRRAAVAS